MSLDVRPAALADAEALAELATQAFRETYGRVVDAATVQAVIDQACSAEAFRKLTGKAADEPEHRLLIAMEDDTIVAFLDFGREPEGLELRRLYTRVGLTSRGIGSALLTQLERSLPAETRYRIVVLAANEKGITFWARHGFHPVDEIDGIGHFAAHRGVRFANDARPEPLLIMEREVTHATT